MTQAPIDELVKKCHSVYKLVIVAVKRAKELAEGAPKLVQTDYKKVTSIALEEIRQGKVVYQPADDDEGEKPARKTKERKEKAVAAGAKKKKS